MSDMDDIYAEFVRDWQAGLAPDLDPFLERVAPSDRDALADLVEAFVMVAPSVELDPARASEIQDSPAFLRALAIADDATPLGWGARLRAGRQRAGLSLADLGARFADAFGIAGKGEKAAGLLGRLEAGDLQPVGVSHPATTKLEELLGLAADALRPPQPQFRGRADPGTEAPGRADPGTETPSPAAAPSDASDWVAGFALALDGDVGDRDELDDLLRRFGD